MARIRTIVPEFWEDERFANVSLPALLLYIGMKNFASDDGVITSNPVVLKSKVFPAREDVRRQQVSLWLQELTGNSVLVPLTYEGKGYYVMDFSSERIDKPKRSGIPQDIIDEAVSGHLRQGSDNPAGNDTPHAAGFATARDHSRPFATPRDDSRMVARILAGEERKGIGEECRGEGGENAHVREAPPPESEDFRLFKDWVSENAPNVMKLESPFTQQQYERIRAEYPKSVIVSVILAMGNYKDLLKRYVSANLTFRKWAKKDMENEPQQRNQPRAGTGTGPARGGQPSHVGDDYKRSILDRLQRGGGAEAVPDG